MPNGKVNLTDLEAVSKETSEISNLIAVMQTVQHAVNSSGTGQSKRDFLASAEFRSLIDRCNSEELEAMLQPLIPAIKRQVRERAETMNRVYGLAIEVPA